jgi:hypothetical protein
MFHGMIPWRPRGRAFLPLVLAAVVLAACAAGGGVRPGPVVSEPAIGGVELVRTELLFGRARPDGSLISEVEWIAFVDEHVTPRFPDGLTVVDARGQYRTRAGQIVREPSKLLIVLHDGSSRSRAALEEIRTAYKRLFDQESVLIMSAPARASY